MADQSTLTLNLPQLFGGSQTNRVEAEFGDLNETEKTGLLVQTSSKTSAFTSIPQNENLMGYQDSAVNLEDILLSIREDCIHKLSPQKPSGIQSLIESAKIQAIYSHFKLDSKQKRLFEAAIT